MGTQLESEQQMRKSGLFAMLAIAMLACNESHKRPPALLGTKSDSTVSALKAACTGRVSEDAVETKSVRTEWLECVLPNEDKYRVVFDQRGRITEISIDAPESDALDIFDRAVAPIVPHGLRDAMRQSVRDPERMKPAETGPCVDVIALGSGWKETGASRHISWHLDECVIRNR
jgi:hypothetical protein